ncbi:50S ribosomal protein L25 [Candidatus Magnetominusculus dajiuhuensis]|uniref:50S ribosomal protein L25 n=1 Tax=Candidatus Magnetominusculus dajiuhuensis TaxID=3137712 RepID=UPI003B42C1C4
MERATLTAEVRETKGKGAARTLRRADNIPSVIYRKGIAQSISLPRKELVSFINSLAGEQVLVNLAFGDGSAKLAIMRNYQTDPIKGELLHVDFYEVSLKETIKVSVGVLLVGTPVGVKRDGGILQAGLREVEIESLPDNIPAHVELDVRGLEIGHSYHVSDIKVGEGIKILSEMDAVVATITVSASAISELAEEASADAVKEPEVMKKGKQEDKDK